MAAQAGTLVAVGKSGKTYSVDLYIPDAVATQLTFNPNGLAGTGSPTNWRAPEDVLIVDISGAAPTAVGFALQVDGATIPGGGLNGRKVGAKASRR